MKKSFLYILMSSLIVASSCNNDDKNDEPNKVEPIFNYTVKTTVSDGISNYYNGLTLQVGLTGSTDVIAEAVVSDGKAVFSSTKDLAAEISGKNVWFGVKGMVKFFHTVTDKEVADSSLTLPDKELGSTLSGSVNDWIVALYIGVNKDGKADGAPLYWATGNIIAEKTNDAGDKTEVSFHVATAEEGIKESTQKSGIIRLDDRLVTNVTDCYAALPKGSKWDLFSYGDKSGLCLYDTDKLNDYVVALKMMSADGSNIVYEVSGNPDYDICTNLGGLWRTPTGGKEQGGNESAVLEDQSFDLQPNGEFITEEGKGAFMVYKHTVTIDGKEVCVNTLKFPATGFRHANTLGSGFGKFCIYWTSTADPTMSEVWGQDLPNKEPQTVAFNYGKIGENVIWFAHPRTSGASVRAVTE